MGMDVKIDTKGLERMIKNSPAAREEGVKTTAFVIQGYATMLAPYKTGALAASVKAEEQGRDVYWVRDGVNYGIYQELGTKFMAAHPFLWPACEKAKSQLASIWRAVLERRNVT